MKRLAFCTVVVAALLAGGLAGCGREPPAAKVAPPRGERLVVREAVVEDLKPVSALVAARDLGEARARMGGVLTKLLVREGDLVRQGQLIGVVVDERIGMQTAALGAQAAAAEAEATRARADLGRVRTLFDKGIYARARLDQAQAAATAAEAEARAARAQQAASAESGAQGRILAPASGRVLKADVPEGSVVVAGQSVATITAGPLLLRLEMPEAEGRALKAGQTVAVDADGAASAGVIVQVYPAADAGRIVADVEVAGLTSDRVGQAVVLKIPVGRRRALILPRRFVATRFGVDFVRTLDKAGRVSEAPVQLGPAQGGGVEVLTGLSAGDVVLGAEPK